MPGHHLVERFQAHVDENEQDPAMRYPREDAWHTVTYAGLRRFVEDLAAGLVATGLEAGDRVGLWSEHRPEWCIAEQATLHAGSVTVAPPSSATPQDATRCLSDANARVVFVDTRAKLEALASLEGGLEGIERVVTMGPLAPGYEDKDKIESMEHAYTRGRGFIDEHPRALQERVDAIDPDDPATLAAPGGARVTVSHGNLVALVDALETAWNLDRERFLPLSPGDGPGRIARGLLPFATGGTVGFARDEEDILSDLQALVPTVITGPPDAFERLRGLVEERLETSRVRRGLAPWALGVGARMAKARGRRDGASWWLRARHAAADRFVLSRLRGALGGSARLLACPGPGAGKALCRFFAAIGAPLVETFGVPEAGFVATANRPRAFRWGSQGQAVPGVEVGTSTEPSNEPGQILVRGAMVPTDPGHPGGSAWVQTGVRGRVDEEGYLFASPPTRP